jgi:hypothetical protein
VAPLPRHIGPGFYVGPRRDHRRHRGDLKSSGTPTVPTPSVLPNFSFPHGCNM